MPGLKNPYSSTRRNPYGVSRTEDVTEIGVRAVQDYAAYAVPEGGYPGPAFPAQPWSPSADRSKIHGTPDPYRTGKVEENDPRIDPARPRWWAGKRARDRVQRESVTSERTTPETTLHGSKRFAQNPRAVPATNWRWTANLSISTYDFKRPMTARSPKRLNGMHFSLADHTRVPESAFGMSPGRTPRTTERVETVGWWERFRIRTAAPDVPDETIIQPRLAPTSMRRFRLV